VVVSRVVCSESTVGVDYQGTDFAFMTQMATLGHTVGVLLKFQAL
jgi:hypothetical protein